MELDGRIRVDRDGHVAVLTIDRPSKLNAFTLEMARELEDAAEALGEDRSVRAIVVTGEGDRAFSAGGDLTSLLPAVVDAGKDIINPDPRRRFFSRVYTPLVAAVRGRCVGGGLEIVLGTDIRVASSDALFGLGETRWGLVPGAGSHVRLPRQIPHAVAMEMLLTGESISASRAHSVGLVNDVVEPKRTLDRALEVAASIARNSPVAVRTAKEIAIRSLALDDAFALEHSLNSRVLQSDDAREGLAAFREKREPTFRDQ